MGHELNLPRAAQEGPAVPGCPEHLLERTKGLFCHQESIQSAIECPVCARPSARAVTVGKKKKNSFEERKGVILRGRSRMRAPSSVMTETVFISSRVVMEENHHQMENVFSILIAMEANQNQLQI